MRNFLQFFEEELYFGITDPYKNFGDYLRLTEALYGNPNFNPIHTMALVIAVLHRMAFEQNERFEEEVRAVTQAARDFLEKQSK